MGYAGQVSFGHNAFAAISGYTSAVLTANHGWEPLPAAGLGLFGALACALIVGYPTLAAARPLPRDGDARDRADRLRGRRAVAVGDARLHGHLGDSAARHRPLHRHVGSRDPGVADGVRAHRRARRRRHPPLAARPRLRRHRGQRGCGARARHRRRALQADRVPDLGVLRGGRRIAVRARGRLRQPGSLRPAHGRARLHDALRRRHRHDRGRGARRAGHRAAARNGAALQRIPGPRLWRGADPDPDLCAGRPRVALALVVARRRRAHDPPAPRLP